MDVHTIKVCAALSKLAMHVPGEPIEEYKQAQNIAPKFTQPPFFYDGMRFTNDNVQAYLWISDSCVFIGFHSSRPIESRNTLTILDTRRVQYPIETKVSSCALERFLALEHFIHADLIKANDVQGFLKLVITGHGFGGTIAVLAAAHFSHVFPDKLVECCSFSAYHAGNKPFRTMFRSKVPNSICILPFDEEVKYDTSCNTILVLNKSGFFTKRRKNLLRKLKLKISNQNAPIPQIEQFIQALM